MSRPGTTFQKHLLIMQVNFRKTIHKLKLNYAKKVTMLQERRLGHPRYFKHLLYSLELPKIQFKTFLWIFSSLLLNIAG